MTTDPRLQAFVGKSLTSITAKGGHFFLAFGEVVLEIGAAPVGWENSNAYAVLPDGTEIMAE